MMTTMVDRRRKKGLNVWFVVGECFMTPMMWFVVVDGDVSAHESL